MRNLSRITARAARALLKSLGRPVQYVRFSADPEAVPQDVVAVFNNASKTIGLGGYEVPVGATSPTLFVLGADLGFPPAQGDRAIVAGETYTVIDPQPDGYGGFTLELHRGVKMRW